MSSNTTPPAQIAVWFFVGATFAFAATTLWIPEAPLWLRIASMIVGFALVIAGGVRLGRELTARREARSGSTGGS